jgi:Tfp pilus assembly protein PilN
MRININLATQKYENAGEFYTRWGIALALVIALTIGLAFFAWHSYQRNVDAMKRIDQLREKIAKLDQERAHAEAVLNRPENQDVRDQSRFWNDVIDQKVFSWTRLLSDMEKLMPARAYLEAVRPNITTDKRLQLRLTVAGEKIDDIEELVQKMEHSQHFRSTVIGAENPPHSQTTNGPMISEFEVDTYYVPGAYAQQHVTATPAPGKSKNAREAEPGPAKKQGAS